MRLWSLEYVSLLRLVPELTLGFLGFACGRRNAPRLRTVRRDVGHEPARGFPGLVRGRRSALRLHMMRRDAGLIRALRKKNTTRAAWLLTFDSDLLPLQPGRAIQRGGRLSILSLLEA